MSAPLTPPDCDLQDFPRMMVDIPRLRGSDFDATLDDGAWRAGVNLWLSAWHQVPAASLPDDDVALTKAAGLGRDVRTWRKLRAEALRGWQLCDDGRLYHETVAELALEAWLEKLSQRLSSGAGNAARWGAEFDPEPIKAEIGATAKLLERLNPKSKALSKQQPAQALRRSRRDTPAVVPSGASGVPPGPPEVPPGSQEKGREGNKSSEDKSSASIQPPADLDATAWQSAIVLLAAQGEVTEPEARRFFGKLLAQHKLQARDLLASVANAMVNATQDPRAYLTKAASGVAKRRIDAEPRRVGWV